MATIGPAQAKIEIFTFKEGLLSAVAHDLLIVADSFEIGTAGDSWPPESVAARVDARSLRVVGAVVGGSVDASVLSRRDLEKIRKNMMSDVLGAKRHAQVAFESTEVGETELRGALSIAGVRRDVVWQVDQEGDGVVASITLHQPDFRIKPFTAMFGTLKVKPDVKVRVTIDGAEAPESAQ